MTPADFAADRKRFVRGHVLFDEFSEACQNGEFDHVDSDPVTPSEREQARRELYAERQVMSETKHPFFDKVT